MKQINITQIDPDEFLSRFDFRLKEILEKISSQKSEELLTRKEAAKYLKISLTTLYYWTKKGKIPAYSVSNRLYYKRSEIDASLIKIN